MKPLVCRCGRAVPPSTPAIGVMEGETVGTWIQLLNCICGSTCARPVPQLTVTVRGIVGVREPKATAGRAA